MSNRPLLLVEDTPDDEVLTLRALKRAKVANEVVVARDGAEALELLHGPNPIPTPQVVLLDLKLPKVDGLEVLRRIRAHPTTRFLPVVILTSSDEERDLIQGYELGANSFVRKPVDFVQFADAIQTLGLFWMVVNALPRTEGGGTHS